MNKGEHVNGILLLNKATGISSHSAMFKAKRLFNAKKAGHTGSLDPLASGMLPVCFGEATKFSQYSLNADKTYIATARLGIKTDTGDAQGSIIEECQVPSLTPAAMEVILACFRGQIAQVPPMYSALKRDGKPLYILARQGISVERPPRTVQIYRLVLLSLGDDTFTIEVSCSKGTYIRSLVEDIGAALGCGAHVTALQRKQIVGLPDTMLTLDALQAIKDTDGIAALQETLLPMDILVAAFTRVELAPADCQSLRSGRQIPRDGDELGMVAVFTQEGQLLGMGEILDNGYLAPRRLISTF